MFPDVLAVIISLAFLETYVDQFVCSCFTCKPTNLFREEPFPYQGYV
jgi:hypothetical protein